MTRLEQLTMSWSDHRLSWYIDCEEVTKDQLETIIDDWLILDEGQFNVYPDATTLYVRKFHLNSIRFFSSSKKIVHSRIELIDELPGGRYRYYVKYEDTTKPCPYETPCGWCTKWDKKCDKKIGCDDNKPQRGLRASAGLYDEYGGSELYDIRSGRGLSCLDAHLDPDKPLPSGIRKETRG